VLLRLAHRDDAPLAHDQAGQPPRRRFMLTFLTALREAVAGARLERLAVLGEQVDRADVSAGAPGDQVRDVAQGLVEIVRVQDQAADILEGRDPERRFLLGWHAGIIPGSCRFASTAAFKELGSAHRPA
jgi:hypothetical protein